jgi:hypothetical protein
MVDNQAAVNVDMTIRRRKIGKILRLSNKVFHLIAPYNVIAFFIVQLRWLESYSDVNRIQQQALSAYLSLGDIDNQFNGSEVIGKWVSILYKFQEGDSSRPHVSSDAIFLSADAFRL